MEGEHVAYSIRIWALETEGEVDIAYWRSKSTTEVGRGSESPWCYSTSYWHHRLPLTSESKAVLFAGEIDYETIVTKEELRIADLKARELATEENQQDFKVLDLVLSEDSPFRTFMVWRYYWESGLS